MLVTDLTKDTLRRQRFVSDMERRGFERVGENGGRLWELYRGRRLGQKIVACEIDPDGLAVWVKVE
jgi:hypothetical protein